MHLFFFFRAEDGIRDPLVTGVQTCALPICDGPAARITAATSSGSVGGGMDRRLPLAQRLRPPPRTHGEDLRDDGERYLLRSVGPDVEPYGPVHAGLSHGVLR